MSGHPEQSEAARKRTAGDAADSTGTAISFLERAGCSGGGKGILIQDDQTGTLSTVNNQAVCYGICSDKSNSMLSGNPHSGIYEADTSRTLDNNCGNPACNQGGIAVVYDMQRKGVYAESGCASTLVSHLEKEANDLVCAVDCRNATESEVNGTLQAKENGGTSYNLNNVCRERYIVRRLTPLECTRLQGYPDGWVDIGDWVDSKGKKHKDADSPKYKALGNSIAIPPWLWVLSRMNEYCDEKTMASLFDGIGGFPLIWEFLNGTGSAVWCSEIEEFPIAVTKLRFPDKEEK